MTASRPPQAQAVIEGIQRHPAAQRPDLFQKRSGSLLHDGAPASGQFPSTAASSSSGGQLSGSFFPGLYHEHSSGSSGYSAPQTETLTRDEAELIHHYAENLGRWMDCTDACRQFTRQVPLLVQTCPILRNAVVAFACKHRKDIPAAERAYQRCLALQIERLSSETVTHDDALLCAIVILRFVEQLDGRWRTYPTTTNVNTRQSL